MNLIKKLFPNYVSKKELKRQLDFVSSLKQPKVEVKNAKTQKIVAKLVVDLLQHQIPESFIYDTLSHELAKEIKKVMDVKKYDDNYNHGTIYSASIEIVESWG